MKDRTKNLIENTILILAFWGWIIIGLLFYIF